MLDQAAGPRAAVHQGTRNEGSESACLAKDMLRVPIHRSKSKEAKDRLIAFDDKELIDWLMEVIVDGSENFLCAIAEAAVSARAQDYGLIRPALMQLKRRYDSRYAIRK